MLFAQRTYFTHSALEHVICHAHVMSCSHLGGERWRKSALAASALRFMSYLTLCTLVFSVSLSLSRSPHLSTLTPPHPHSLMCHMRCGTGWAYSAAATAQVADRLHVHVNTGTWRTCARDIDDVHAIRTMLNYYASPRNIYNMLACAVLHAVNRIAHTRHCQAETYDNYAVMMLLSTRLCEIYVWNCAMAIVAVDYAAAAADDDVAMALLMMTLMAMRNSID